MMDLLQAIDFRRSVRSFDGAALKPTELKSFSAMLESCAAETGPFGHKIRLSLHAGEADGKPAKLGTYGLISGASAFIVPAVSPGPGASEDIGYILEKAVLQSTAMGWASCWIGGVFSRGRAALAAGLRDGEFVPVVIALGRPAVKRSLADKLVTGAARSRQRKPLKEIVFSAEGVGISESSLEGPWLSILKAFQMSPSASNKQPWRLIETGDDKRWLLCLEEDKLYNNSLGETHIQNIDMGIAMCHIAIAASCLGLEGSWVPPGGARTQAALALSEARGWRAIALWNPA